MGAWGALAFDNDNANDWAYDLEETSDLSLVETAFAAVGDAETYIDSDDACNALAACEVLARLRGNFGYRNAYTKKVDVWVAKHPCVPPQELLARAASVIDRILGDDSELNELWAGSSEWLEAVADLRRRTVG